MRRNAGILRWNRGDESPRNRATCMPPSDSPESAIGRGLGVVIAIAGILAGQVILFGPSLAGQKILLPVDLLSQPAYYLPQTPETRAIESHNRILSDPLLAWEFSRRFAARELRSGRAPIWNPYGFCGAPTAVFPVYSPFFLPYYLFPSPYTLAWIQLLVSLVAGLGAFAFFRIVLGVGVWPAVIGAWCYPLTGFFVLWQGLFLTHPVAWLPWLLLATDATVRRRSRWGAPALAVTTALVLFSGYGGAHALLAAGLYAAWGVLDAQAWRASWGPIVAAAAPTLLAFGLGLLLAAPHWAPLVEYVGTSARMSGRTSGSEDRPPVGLSALPEVVAPEIYGSSLKGSYRITAGNRLESTAGAYAGLLATLVLAPLAWRSRRHRSINFLFAVLTVLSLGWLLNLPGLVTVLRMPGLNALSHNRAVFVASFALLSMAVIGLDVLRTNDGRGRRFVFIAPVLLLATLAVFCLYRSVQPPEPVATHLEQKVLRGKPAAGVRDLATVVEVQASFRRSYQHTALLCGLGLGGWLLVFLGVRTPRAWVAAPGALLVGELLWFAYDVSPQPPPELYYPPVPVLSRLADAPPGRILCLRCLPARLNESHDLRDIRGYDAADPARLVDLLDIARDRQYRVFSYARTQWYAPKVSSTTAGDIVISPVLDMLNLRYLIFREPLHPWLEHVETLMREADYVVFENPRAMPRAYIPRRAVASLDDQQTLERLAAPDFDPRDVAYVHAAVDLPEESRGTAKITSEIPREIDITVEMETPGLLVLADLWYEGWQARIDGKTVPIWRTNYALRGVPVGAGRSRVELRYEPRGHTWGLRMMAGATGILLAWSGLAARNRNNREADRQVEAA